MAVHRALALKPHNSNFPCMSPAFLELPPPPSPGQCSQMSASVYNPIRRHPGFQLPSILPGQTNRILADFLCQMLWELLFQTQDFWEARCGARSPQSSGGNLYHQGVPPGTQLLSVGFGTAPPFFVSVPPMRLNVAYSLYS